MSNLLDYVKIYPLLTVDECNYILNEVKNDNFYRALTTKVGESEILPQVDNYRTNSQTFIKNGSVSDGIVYERIALGYTKWMEELPKIQQIVWKNNYINVLDTGYEINKYEVGEYYDTHIDDIPSKQFDRILSIVIYLNDDYEGGELEFPFLKYKPTQGSGILFPSNWMYPHKSLPVIKGTKYSLVTWIVNK
jgi:Rps23 Pro-64 3,4-dihydroxylase Tpa1-like proline 4-hydroxylase